MFANAKPGQKQESKSTVQKKESEEKVDMPNLTGIPDGMKSQFENFSGFSFNDVRVHYNSGKPAQLQALAYTQGNQVYVAPGQEKHLEHELGHVVQQKQGRVRATASVGGVAVNDDIALEREADSPLQFKIESDILNKEGNISNITQKKDDADSEENATANSTGIEVMMSKIEDIANKGVEAKIPEAESVLSLISDLKNILDSENGDAAAFLEKFLTDELEKREVDIPDLSELESVKDDAEEDVVQGFWLEALWCVIGIPIAFVAAVVTSPILAIALALKNVIGYSLRDLPQQQGAPTPQVPSDRKAGFSAILQGMPFVQDLFNNNVQANMAAAAAPPPPPQNIVAQPPQPVALGWRNGGRLQDNINEVDDGNFVTRDRSERNNGNFNRKVAKADSFIRQAVDLMVLGNIDRPAIQVHLRNKMAVYRPWGFRAYYSNDNVHVAQDEDTDIIVHEVGHHIENSDRAIGAGGPMQDIDVLLRSRNENNATAGYIFPWSFKEQRYSGDYPATGRYTSKHYAHGSTEVMSMSLEYLSHPQKFRRLIQQDPQQAAIILRIIQPAQFGNLNLNPQGNHDYAQYLP